MKIIAPASSLEDISEYKKLGVDEVYLGFKRAKNKWELTNKRNEKNANFLSLKNIKKIKDLVPTITVSFTLNNSFFNNKQLNQVKKQIHLTKSCVDNYIIADPSLINLIQKIAPKKGIILSCIGTCFNSETVKFYERLGVKRIILPRHLNINEIETLVKNNPDFCFEVFILNQFCRNVDGFCSRCHIPNGEHQLSNCYVPFSSKVLNLKKGNQKTELVHKNISSILTNFKPECGICFLKKLEEIGIKGVKIVGRDHDSKRKFLDAKLIKDVLELSELNEETFENKCKALFIERFGIDCKNNCYY